VINENILGKSVICSSSGDPGSEKGGCCKPLVRVVAALATAVAAEAGTRGMEAMARVGGTSEWSGRRGVGCGSTSVSDASSRESGGGDGESGGSDGESGGSDGESGGSDGESGWKSDERLHRESPRACFKNAAITPKSGRYFPHPNLINANIPGKHSRFCSSCGDPRSVLRHRQLSAITEVDLYHWNIIIQLLVYERHQTRQARRAHNSYGFQHSSTSHNRRHAL